MRLEGGGGADKSVTADVEEVQVAERAKARGQVDHQVVRQHQHPAATTRVNARDVGVFGKNDGQGAEKRHEGIFSPLAIQGKTNI